MSSTTLGARRGGAVALAELQRLLDYRDLLWLLVQKDLKIKYKGTVLGLFWSLLNPLLLMAVYAAVFSILVRFTVPRYPIFILSALLPWNAFAAALTQSVLSLVINGNLVRRVSFPIEF